MMDTIFSLASARGKAGVSVIRISGPHSLIATKKISGNLPQFRTAGLRKIIASDGRFLDEALVLCFEEGASFTGECVVELQLHGSTAVVKAVLEELSTHDGLRMAEPGEFTRRALENERLDLTQVEGLADLLEAETEAQRRQALTVLSGKLGEIAGKWRKSLIRAAALLEATIDFADEDVPYDVSPEVNELLSNILIELNKEVDSVKISERIRDGFVIAILGEPNIGKSTLLNALAGRDVAITSEIAGTTRDVIEVQMDLAGLPVTILDTAGLRETTDIVEELGVRKGIDRAKAADLRVFLKSTDDTEFMLTPEIDDIIAYGKGDMVAPSVFSVSGLTGKGIDQLIDIISKKLGDRIKGAGVATRERHRVEMVNALDAIIYAQEEVSYGPERAEFAAEQMRVAIRSLDSLVGRIDVEHLLDEIFSSFCLGK